MSSKSLVFYKNTHNIRNGFKIMSEIKFDQYILCETTKL